MNGFSIGRSWWMAFLIYTLSACNSGDSKPACVPPELVGGRNICLDQKISEIDTSESFERDGDGYYYEHRRGEYFNRFQYVTGLLGRIEFVSMHAEHGMIAQDLNAIIRLLDSLYDRQVNDRVDSDTTHHAWRWEKGKAVSVLLIASWLPINRADDVKQYSKVDLYFGSNQD